VLKFRLRILRQEQRRRLLAGLHELARRWKFSMDDAADYKLWDRYIGACEDAVRNTATRRRHGTQCRRSQMVRLAHGHGSGRGRMERLDLRFLAVRGKARHELERVRGAMAQAAKGLINEDRLVTRIWDIGSVSIPVACEKVTIAQSAISRST
jgi:hypothetical protein